MGRIPSLIHVLAAPVAIAFAAVTFATVALVASPSVCFAGSPGAEHVSWWLAQRAAKSLERDQDKKLRRGFEEELESVDERARKVAKGVFRSNGRRAVLFEKGRLTEAGEAVAEALMRVENHGVSPRQFGLERLDELLHQYRRSAASLERPVSGWEPPAGWEPPERPPYPPALQEAVQRVDRLAQRHLDIVGRLDARLVTGLARFLHDVGGLSWRKRRDFERAVRDIVRDPQAGLASVLPRHPQYERLTHALERYLALWRGRTLKPIPEGAPLVQGDRSAAVSALRGRLIWEGFLAKGEGAGGSYDGAVVDAVKRFQYAHGLVPSGEVDGPTRVALDRPAEWWVRQLVVALERWRESAVSRHDGTLVHVNIPEYVATVWLDGKVEMRQRALVGKPSTRTRTMDTMMREFRVNPRWNVPAGVQRREVEPRSARDAGFLAKHHFVQKKARGGGVRYIQEPGPWNWLGRVIFPVYNHHNIALHGSLRDHLFGEPKRAYSNGCVNLEDEVALARLLLSREDNPALGELDQWLEGWRTRRVRLRRPIPVVIEYQTTVVDDDGTVRFLPDIYRKDGPRLNKVDLDAFAKTRRKRR